MRRFILISVSVFFILVIVVSLIILSKKNTKQIQKNNLDLSQVESLINSNELLKAKELAIKLKEKAINLEDIKKIQNKIEELNIKILFSPVIDNCSTLYKVKEGDSLIKLAKNFNTTVELIKRANNLNSDIIRPNQNLKINTCKFSILVDKSQNTLTLKTQDEIIKTYIVSTGKDNSTPTGNFKIINKLKNPTWFKTGAVIPSDSPENILGSRWLGFNIKGYGIHGTTEPDNLGKQVTSGCIRMKNSEVEELYDIVPEGTEVVIVD